MKNILLAVTGLSPQVVTEAVFALAAQGRTVDEIRLITTRSGHDEIAKHLLHDNGKLDALCREYSLPRPLFGPHMVRVLRDRHGRALEDIITSEDNDALLSCCLEHAWEHTRREDATVFFLVAGGRKTMTSCLTLAAQMYGRRRDRLYHVLVSPEFESCRDFWYPPRASRLLELRDKNGQQLFKNTRYATVRLITIPFVSVRDMLVPDLLDRPRTPAELMQSLVRDTPPALMVDLSQGKVRYGDSELDLHPAQLALYAFFAEQKKNCPNRTSCAGCFDCFLESGAVIGHDGITAMYRRIPGSRLADEMSNTGIDSLSTENFNSYKSKIRKKLLEAFGPSDLADLEIGTMGKRPDTRYGIRLDKKRIIMKW